MTEPDPAEPDLTIVSLAERLDLAPVVAAWHWDEWGRDTTDASEADWLATLQRRARADDIPFTLVALVGDRPVGAVSVCWDDVDDRFADRGPWLSGMVVRNDARNLGVGRALLDDVAARCRALGHLTLWLHTAEARDFYRRCGWMVEADKVAMGADAVLSRRLPLAGTASGVTDGTGTVRIEWRGTFENSQVNRLHAEAFDTRVFADDEWNWVGLTLAHSLGWVTAHRGEELVGFVNVISDGFVHAWLQDLMVSKHARRRGLGRQLVSVAVKAAREAGCEWLHVDFDDDLRSFYLDACGFEPAAAGILDLTET